jgi:hypothetical protein
MLMLEELRAEVDVGRIDTVLLAICDLQGRLQGKRPAARHLRRRPQPAGTRLSPHLDPGAC